MDAMTPSRLLVAHGARAAEDLLLARLADLAAEARRDPALLARPVRVVVPSISLRDHLATAIVHRAGRAAPGRAAPGRAMVGVRVMTLLNVALASRALLFHGFAGANGVEGDLLESLLRIVGGDVYLDSCSAAERPRRRKRRLPPPQPVTMPSSAG